MVFLRNNYSYSDAAEPWQFGTQDPATPIMEGMIHFHNYLVFYIIFIGIAVCWLLYKIVIDFNVTKNPIPLKFNHHSLLEIVWTILPAVVLVFIAVPSFSLLYSLDDLVEPSLTVKIVGHQWYWSYEYSGDIFADEFGVVEFDSYILPESDFIADASRYGGLRLLETDNRVVLPIETHIRLLITSADVLHSWAVPSFGIKVDACPGRLSQASIFIKRPGVFYGQCSEICGVNHGFMPIVVHAIDPLLFEIWFLRTVIPA